MAFDLLAWLATSRARELFVVSVVSRILLIVWMWFSNRVIGGGMCYDSCDFFYHTRYRSTNFLNHWDGVHFRHVADSGYSHEHVHAFFPGVPGLHIAVEHVLGLPPIAINVLAVGAYSIALLALRSFTTIMAHRHEFCTTTMVRRRNRATSGFIIDKASAPTRFIGATVFLFLLSPTNVFTVVSYTESFFACACIVGLYCMSLDPVLSVSPLVGGDRRDGWVMFLCAWVCFVVASLFRSNGFLLAFIVMVPAVVTFLRAPVAIIRLHRRWLAAVIVRGLMCLAVVGPYLFANYVGWDRYCRSQGDVGVDGIVEDRCKVTGFYPMIQSVYWNVGWFRQWTVKNAPNFLIAAPPILLGVQCIVRHASVRDLVRAGAGYAYFNVQIWHLVGLWYLAITTIHVQVVNRLVFACPAVYWVGAWQLISEPRGWVTRLQIAYCIVCSILGPLMFANKMNWT